MGWVCGAGFADSRVWRLGFGDPKPESLVFVYGTVFRPPRDAPLSKAIKIPCIWHRKQPQMPKAPRTFCTYLGLKVFIWELMHSLGTSISQNTSDSIRQNTYHGLRYIRRSRYKHIRYKIRFCFIAVLAIPGNVQGSNSIC